MKAEGIALPASVDQDARGGRDRLLRRRPRVRSPARASTSRAPSDPREATLRDPAHAARRRCSRTTAPRRGTSATACSALTLQDQGQQHRRRRHQHAATARSSKAESDFRGMLISNQGEHFCVGANLFLVVMAAQQKQWDDIRADGHGLPVRDAADEVRDGAGGRRAVRHDARRRPRALLRRDAVQAAAETYSGLVEVGVGLIPGGAGTLNMLWRALESIPEGVDVRRLARSSPRCSRTSRWPRSRPAPMEAKRCGYFRRDRRRLVRPRAPAPRGQAARDRPGRGRLPPADAARVQAAGRERHRHAGDDGRHAGRRRLRHRARRARSRASSASVLCGGVGGAAPRGDRGRDPRARARGVRQPVRRAARARSACSTCS